MKTLYFDCFAGASGNMILGALVNLGVDENALVEQIKLLDIADFSIEFSRKTKSGISAIYADVRVPQEKTHRHLSTIEKIINNSRLPEKIKTRSIKIFRKLAEAEAKIHGIEPEKVHFHEVGAMDAIIDVVGACVGFEMLGIEKFVCSKIHVGSGFVEMAHGKYPIPPPAVAELLQNAPIYSTEIEGELITPTGAAIISTVCQEFGNLNEMIIEKTAYGAGFRDYKNFPNVLRLILGEVADSGPRISAVGENEQLTIIETNIDDLSAEILGFVMERAFEIGALDCWFTPIQMKKNRPAVMVSILCKSEQKEIFSDLLFTETSTLGLRTRTIERQCLSREIVESNTEFGVIDIKITRYKNKIVNLKPEFEQVRAIALKYKKSYREIQRIALDNLESNE